MFTPPGYAKVSPQSRRLSIVSARPSPHPCSPCPWHTRNAPVPTRSTPHRVLSYGSLCPTHTTPTVGLVAAPALYFVSMLLFAACLPRALLILASLISAAPRMRSGWGCRAPNLSCITSSVLFLDRRCVSRGFVDSAARLQHCLLSC